MSILEYDEKRSAATTWMLQDYPPTGGTIQIEAGRSIEEPRQSPPEKIEWKPSRAELGGTMESTESGWSLPKGALRQLWFELERRSARHADDQSKWRKND